MFGKEILKQIEFTLKYRYELSRMHRHVRRQQAAVPTILIAGASRSGKSTLAKRLSASMGYCHLDFDKFKPYIVARRTPEQKQQLTEQILRSLLGRFPTGLCIEGSLLVYGPCSPVIEGKRVRKKYFVTVAADRSTTAEEKQAIMRDAVADLKICEFQVIANEFATPLFAITSTDSVAEKHQGILRYRQTGNCWSLAGASDEEVYYLAMQNVFTSQRLRELCRETNLSSIDINSSEFESGIGNGIQRILEKVAIQADKQAVIAA